MGPLLEGYAALARGERPADELMAWLEGNLVDSTGHRPGVTLGSFRPTAERAWASLRPTAAEERANQKRGVGKAKKVKLPKRAGVAARRRRERV